jgi:hypothetical protein
MSQKDAEHDKLIAKVMRDESFRKRLLAVPKSALQEIGVTFPPGVAVHVHEETPNDVHIVVPAAASYGGPELSEEALAQVAGGLYSVKRTGCCTCGASTSQTASSLQNGCGC